MNSILIFPVVTGFVFGGALLGMHLRRALPDHHLNTDSKDALKLATGLIGTLAALVLGLLISSAKASFDRVNTELVENAARAVNVDRILAAYGEEARPLRDALKSEYGTRMKLLTSGEPSAIAELDSAAQLRRLEAVSAQLALLTPHNEAQQTLKARASQLATDIASTRTLVILHKDGSIPLALLVVLVSWLVVIFASFGLLAPRNPTVIVALFVGALSASGAILLMLEMDRPFSGLISINSAPLLDAAAHLGQ